MKYNPEKHHRRSIRLKGYDYSRPGAYFITLCAHDPRYYIFGEVKNGQMVLNESGNIVAEEWDRTVEIRKEVKLDAFEIMPNHIHGILVINESTEIKQKYGENPNLAGGTDTVVVGATGRSPLQQPQPAHLPTFDQIEQWATFNPKGPKSKSVGSFVAGFKSVITKQINEKRGMPGSPVWQRNYYEHIIRNERELAAIRNYIINNPVCWEQELKSKTNHLR